MPASPHYEALERTGSQMVAAARRRDWDLVSRLETVAQEQISAFKAAHQPAPTCQQARQGRVAAMKVLLRLDAEVRNLAEPGWNRMERWLNTAASRQGQVGAYFADTNNKY